MISKDTIAEVTWGWNCQYFLETEEGNFVWRNPDYEGGDHTIVPFKGTLGDWYKKNNMDYGRAKGRHRIGDYCGENVVICGQK